MSRMGKPAAQQPAPSPAPPPAEKIPAIAVGRRPTMNYVLAAMLALQQGDGWLVVKARGRAINKAVNVVQILKNRFFKGLQVVEVKLGSEERAGQDGRTRTVSTMEILVRRGAA